MPVETTYTDFIIKMIKKCAETNQIPAQEVTWNKFYSYLTASLKDKGEKLDPKFFNKLKQVGGFGSIKKAFFPEKLSREFFENRKLASENTKILKEELTHDLFFKRFKEINTELSKKALIITPKVPKKKEIIQRHLHLILSDLHFGARLNAKTGTLKYGPVEASRRLARVVSQTADYKPQYRPKTKLFVNLLGDIIQGKLHDPLDGEEQAAQCNEAIWLLKQALAYLATQFPEVEVFCATGNHDRNTSRHKERATLGKDDSWATVIYFAVQQALEHIPNIKIHIPKTPWITYKSFGVNYFGTHGDTVLKLPNVGSSINISSIENQINKLNASLTDKEEYKVVFAGHVHTGLVLKLSNGVTFITNPALIPADNYAQSIGIFESQTGQFLWESVEGYPFGDSRFLLVDEKTDLDSSLDKIIKPFGV